MTTLLSYPAELPCPQTSTVTPAERRALSDAQRPRDARALQRDRLEYERLTWPPMNAVQCEALLAWWRVELIYGGAWFVATWPLPRGLTAAVRKLREQPRWEYVAGGYWRISALCEVRGRGEIPISDCAEALAAAELAQTQALYIYGTFFGAFPVPQDGVYYNYNDPGPVIFFPWTFPVVMAWDALAAPPGVSVFSGIRVGASTIPLASVSVTNVPIRRSCRACVFQTGGAWDGLDVLLPNTAVHAATWYPDGGAGFWAAQFLLINNYGTITGEFL